jgi:peptide/nickel transport system substrate-binding protein
MLVGGVAAMALVATACGGGSGGGKTSSGSGSSKGSGSSGNSSSIQQKFAVNNTGTPRRGGVLTMLGTGDVDFMDPNISYYSIGYLGLRMWARGLYAYQAKVGKTTTLAPDIATAMPTITNGGKTYSVTIKKGVMWDTNPPRQVTAADVVRGLKRSCNPTQPFGGEPDYSSLVVGYTTFCNGFSKVNSSSASAEKAYIDGNNISGVSVSPSNPETVVVNLTHPASYFTDILSLPPFFPAPVEFLNYLPGSNQLAQNTISDGPYKIASYDPGKSIDFVRNPAWNASTDSIRKAYVNEIKVSETGNQNAIEQQIETNTPAADMEWDSFVPIPDVPRLLNDPRLTLASEYSSNPYIIFNTVSPNNGGALGKVAVRQALEYALDRAHLIQDAGGPNVSPPLTQILPPGITGSSPSYNLYNYNLTKAKQMLAAAGFAHGMTLKFLYRPASDLSSSMFQTVQADLAKVGITVKGVGVPNADFYTKYLEVPTVAKNGTWDLSLAGWSPDWYGNAAVSFFSPLFDGRVLPPSSSNFGMFNDPKVNALIDRGVSASSASQAAGIWHQADMQVMKDAAIFPITDPNQPVMHGSQVHNAVYVAAIEQIDPTNVWLSNG